MNDRFTIYRRIYFKIKKVYTDCGFTEDRASRLANLSAVKNTNKIYLAEQELAKYSTALYNELMGDGAFLKE